MNKEHKWRANLDGGVYWFVCLDLKMEFENSVCHAFDIDSELDRTQFEMGNYFKTYWDAVAMAESIKQLLKCGNNLQWNLQKEKDIWDEPIEWSRTDYIVGFKDGHISKAASFKDENSSGEMFEHLVLIGENDEKYSIYE